MTEINTLRLIDDAVISFNQQNDTVTEFLSTADASYTDSNYSNTTIAADYVGVHDRPTSYELTLKSSGIICFYDEDEPQRSWDENVNAGTYAVYDLIPGHTYRWTLVNSGEYVQSGRITSTGKVRMIYSYVEDATWGTSNIRDLGGWDCDGGTFRYGVLYRGAAPVYISNKTKAKALGIRNQIDLWTGVKYLIYDTINYLPCPLPDNGGSGNIDLSRNYWKTSAKALKYAMNYASGESPTYIHCAAGADRTGTISWLLHAIAGCSEADCDKDYELTVLANLTNRSRVRNHNLPDYILTLGDTVRDGAIKWCQKVGITEDEVNAYRSAVSSGTPEIIHYTWNVVKNLQNVTMSGAETASGTYSATVTPVSGYDLGSCTVIMDGEDITSSVYTASTGVISISKVTGNIEITASGVAQVTSYTNVLNEVGYYDGKYASEPLGNYGNDASYWATGVITWDATKPMYILGWNPANASHSRFYMSTTANGSIDQNVGYNSKIGDTSVPLYTRLNVTILDANTGYAKIEATDATRSRFENDTIYTVISLPGTGGGKIITIGEEITN